MAILLLRKALRTKTSSTLHPSSPSSSIQVWPSWKRPSHMASPRGAP